MAGKKRELLNQIENSTAQCQTLFERFTSAVIDLPYNNGRTYTVEFNYCEERIDPELEALAASCTALERAIGGLGKYIKETKWNLFKKESRATAERCQAEAQAYLQQLGRNIGEFCDSLSGRTKDVLNSHRQTRELLRELVPDLWT